MPKTRSERLYTEQEFALILRRAIELDWISGVNPAPVLEAAEPFPS